MLKSIKRWCRTYLEDKRNVLYVNRIMKENRLEIKEIEIETINRCNGKCTFCPVNVNEPQREYSKMPTKLFYKIIGQLMEINYEGRLSIFSNNEPFLDDRIIEFYKYSKERLPNAKLSLYTNGTLMDLEKFKKIVDFLDDMVVDNYNDDLEVLPNLKEVFMYLQEHSELQDKVNFVVRPQDQVRTSRGGQAPNKRNAKGIHELCLLPFRIFEKYFHYDVAMPYYAHRWVWGAVRTNQWITEKIESGEPFMVARFGNTELQTAVRILKERVVGKSTENTAELHKWFERLENWSGFSRQTKNRQMILQMFFWILAGRQIC